MTDAYSYKGFELSPAVKQLRDSKRWTLRVSIVKHRDSERVTNQQFFDAANTFETKEEAESESLVFGRRIIDGEIKGLGVDGL
ncbi:MAG: hypothetical protein R3F37_15815 [Candidatus Competibacteraceae bacterium]